MGKNSFKSYTWRTSYPLNQSSISLPESGVAHDGADPRAFLSDPALSSSACQRQSIHKI